MSCDAVHQRKKFVVVARRLVAFVAWNLNAHRACKGFNRFNEAHVIEFHQEADRSAMRATAKTVVETFARTDCERRCFLAVKRAAGFEFATSLLEWHASANNFNDVCSCDQIVDKIRRY